jgi:hypothetical protein
VEQAALIAHDLPRRSQPTRCGTPSNSVDTAKKKSLGGAHPCCDGMCVVLRS